VIYLSVLFSALFYFSCSTSNGGEVDDTQAKALLLSPGELKGKINEHSARLTSLDCEGDLSIDSPDLSSSGSITLSIFKPDSIYSKIEGPFGISIAQFLFTRNNFIYYNIRENTVYKGPSSQLNIGALLKLKLNFDDLIDGYSCSFCFSDTSSSNAEVTKDKDLYVLIINEQNLIKKYWVNSKYFYVEKYGIYDKSGNTKLLIEYAEFESGNTVYSPNNVYISNPSEKQNLWINYGKKTFNNNRLKFKLKIPKSAKVINWD
jgi:outer membrane lipoprotein-sorting protein